VRSTKEPTPGMIGDEFDYPVVTTDAHGRFALTDVKGALLSVKSMEKPGYETSEKSINRAQYWYWRNPEQTFKPDSDKPEIFHMWKKAGAEHLVHASKFYGIVPDGRSYAIDVLQEKKTEGGSTGDFKVSIRRPSQVASDEKYDWACVVEGIGGGVVEASEEQMYRAPAVGYQQRYEVNVSANDPQWSGQAKRNFYLRSREGRVYARLEVEILSNYRDKAVFNVEYYANPAGSRNLEYDPLQDVVKPTPVKKP